MGTLAARRSAGGRARLRLRAAMAFGVLLTALGALPALAHTPSVTAGCAGLNVSLQYYNTTGDNSVSVTIDGNSVAQVADFGSTYAAFFPWADSADHTYAVSVQAWDDPTGSKGWSKSWQGSLEACNPPPTTTTTQPPTTTTTQPPTTTTTQPETTTTVTEPPSTTTTQPSTTTTQPSTTTTQPTTTTVTEPPSTTQVTTPPSTSIPFDSIPEVSVKGIEVSAPAQMVTESTLPFTGLSATSVALFAAALAAVGLLLLAASRQVQEKSPARDWN